MLAVRCRELKLEKDLQHALESHSHMQAQLKSLAHDRGDLIARLHALQVSECNTSTYHLVTSLLFMNNFPHFHGHILQMY